MKRLKWEDHNIRMVSYISAKKAPHYPFGDRKHFDLGVLRSKKYLPVMSGGKIEARTMVL